MSGGNDRLRLKGRVYARHISKTVDSSRDGELTLTVKMSEDALDEFVMVFQDRATLDQWKTQLDAIVANHHVPTVSHPPPPAPSAGMGRGRPLASSVSNESLHSNSEYGSDSSRSAALSSGGFSGFTRTTTSSTPLSSVIHEEEACDSGNYQDSPYAYSSPIYRGPSSGSHALSAARTALQAHAPIDLMLILSVPFAGQSSLKVNIIKQTLDFVVNNVGPRTRLSLVTYSTGDGLRGSLHKTPFIALGTDEGRARMDAIIGEIGSDDDNVALIEHKEDRVNVVTAVNLALDIVLQRKVCFGSFAKSRKSAPTLSEQAKSALTGIVLMNDGKDGAQKQQMDLVKIRAEAAKCVLRSFYCLGCLTDHRLGYSVPIHCIGWGRSHDPSTLWLLSDHTGGTYTHCKEFCESLPSRVV